jgi:hypothetical protein
MEYKSNLPQVIAAMKLCRREFCQGVGAMVVETVQGITPIGVKPDPHPGNLKRSVTYEVMSGDEGVTVGVTDDAKYALTVEKGLHGQRAQPYLEPGAMASLPKITGVAEGIYMSKLGGE